MHLIADRAGDLRRLTPGVIQAGQLPGNYNAEVARIPGILCGHVLALLGRR